MSPDPTTLREFSNTSMTLRNSATKETAMIEISTSAALFDFKEIVVGRRLGCGSFCDLYEVRALKLNQDEEDIDMCSQWKRDCLARNKRRRSGELRYCVKYIKPRWMGSHDSFEMAAQHLSNEVELLMELKHPNIASVLGVAKQGTEAYYHTGRHDSYFMIQERMQETLADRISRWRRQHQHRNGGGRSKGTSCFSVDSVVVGNTIQGKRKRRISTWTKNLLNRLNVTMEIAKTFEYLHRNRIVHRDLRPINFGFQKADGSCTIQLMDFGLARQIPDDEKTLQECPSTIKLVANPYMAPEVLWGDNYNCSADVFSFTTLLYEIITLKKVKCLNVRKPGATVSNLQFKAATSKEPLPEDILSLFRKGWSIRRDDRPSISLISIVLHCVSRAFQDNADDTLSKTENTISFEAEQSTTSALNSSLMSTEYEVGDLLSESRPSTKITDTQLCAVAE